MYLLFQERENVRVILQICESLYSSITNKMQRYTMVFVTINALHVSGGFSAHHQELKTVYTASGYLSSCLYSFELLMMGRGTS